MRDITARFVLVAPLVILGLDGLVWHFFGARATITAVVRDWHDDTPWTEFIFVAGCTLLYFHFFRDWP